MALEEDKFGVRNLVHFHRFPNADALFLYRLPESYFF
jgi:hypothetical protein